MSRRPTSGRPGSPSGKSRSAPQVAVLVPAITASVSRAQVSRPSPEPERPRPRIIVVEIAEFVAHAPTVCTGGVQGVYGGCIRFSVPRQWLAIPAPRHIRNTPKRVSSTGALRAARKDSASTSRLRRGSMIPSSQSLADA